MKTPIQWHSLLKIVSRSSNVTDITPCIDIRFSKMTSQIDDELEKWKLLCIEVSSYLPSSSVPSIDGIVKLYMDAKTMYPLKMRLTNSMPSLSFSLSLSLFGIHYLFSLRTLTRSLVFAGDGRFDNENRCLFEAFSMAFLSNMEGRDKVSS